MTISGNFRAADDSFLKLITITENLEFELNFNNNGDFRLCELGCLKGHSVGRKLIMVYRSTSNRLYKIPQKVCASKESKTTFAAEGKCLFFGPFSVSLRAHDLEERDVKVFPNFRDATHSRDTLRDKNILYRKENGK